MTSLTRNPAAPRTLSLALGLAALVLAMGLIEFGPAWYFPVDGRDATIVRVGGSEYRVLLWALIVLTVAVAATRARAGAALRAIAPFMPFVAVAALSAAVADGPRDAFWYLAQWLVMAVAAAFAGAQLPSGPLRRVAWVVFAAVLVGSLALYFASPSAGVMRVEGRALLRGLFAGKNAAGWFAALACVWTLSSEDRWVNPWTLAIVPVALAVMALAQSATAIAMFAAGGSYLVLVRALRRAPVPAGVKALVAVVCIAAVAASVQFGLPRLLELLGRDATLSGRTELWGLYWRFMQDRIVLGHGPGAFAAGSVLNVSISPHLQSDKVVSVHSLYLSMFGDTGLLGAALFVGAFLYVAVAAPFVDPSREALMASILAVMVLGAGFTEARDTLAPSLASFLMFASRAAAAGRPLPQPRRRAAPAGRARAPRPVVRRPQPAAARVRG